MIIVLVFLVAVCDWLFLMLVLCVVGYCGWCCLVCVWCVVGLFLAFMVDYGLLVFIGLIVYDLCFVCNGGLLVSWCLCYIGVYWFV